MQLFDLIRRYCIVANANVKCLLAAYDYFLLGTL